MSELERLLAASVTLEAQKKYIAKLERDNDRLRRALGKARLLADIRRDIREASMKRICRDARTVAEASGVTEEEHIARGWNVLNDFRRWAVDQKLVPKHIGELDERERRTAADAGTSSHGKCAKPGTP
jgi:hypothetical protein